MKAIKTTPKQFNLFVKLVNQYIDSFHLADKDFIIVHEKMPCKKCMASVDFYYEDENSYGVKITFNTAFKTKLNDASIDFIAYGAAVEFLLKPLNDDLEFGGNWDGLWDRLTDIHNALVHAHHSDSIWRHCRELCGSEEADHEGTEKVPAVSEVNPPQVQAEFPFMTEPTQKSR